jgi:hypothetical protein
VSESHGDGQPESADQPKNSGQPDNKGQGTGGQTGSNRSQSRTNGQPGTGGQTGSNRSQSKTNGQPGGGGQSRRPSDPIADFQRWLMRAGARSMANQVADQVRRTVGQERRSSGDVWDTATNELPPNEPPECQWCPVCQAARAARLSGPGLGARLVDAGGVLASVAQDFFSAFDQFMKTQDQNHQDHDHSAERPGVTPPAPEPDPGDAAP